MAIYQVKSQFLLKISESLIYRSFEIKDEELKNLGKALSKLKSVKKIDFDFQYYDRQMKKQNFISFLKFFIQNFRYSEISDSGFLGLVRGLKKFPCFEDFRLSFLQYFFPSISLELTILKDVTQYLMKDGNLSENI